MSHAEDAHPLRRLLAKCLASLLAALLALPVHAAQTDISSTPIITTTAALVKPNIMLLMDASDSMARTHMPDEVEFQTGVGSIGYKSSQCNALYYNPATTYFLPKRANGTPFPAPPFNAAPYAGFGSYYQTPDVSTTNLTTSFVPYDATTVELSPPAITATPQAAYYYVYSGPQAPSFAQAPCTDADVGATTPASGPGGGTWTKVVVGAAEQQNFANWYSFYRTRLALIKSAASLAFAPLNDTKRVGFITVEPKDTPTSSSINPLRYLPIADFDSTQKNAWFSKLFSQKADGLSPAREGLARVGRHFAGKQDSINNGMTGDPVQYACQQNFTIMTTDGYWNGQSETPGFGGALALDGTTKVGQQDGDPTCPLSDPYCPRPIFDGVAGSIRKVTDKTNAYSDNVCSLAAVRYKDTSQTTRRQFVVKRDTTRQVKTAVQYRTSKSQAVAQTSQTTRTVTQTQQTTRQYALSKTNRTEERYQHVKYTEQTTQATEQYELQTVQLATQTFQTRQIRTQTQRRVEQWSVSSSQYVLSKTQYVQGTTQYRYAQDQKYQEKFQIYRYDHSAGETGTAISGPCTPSANDYPIECRRVTVQASRLVDPATCVGGEGPSPQYIRTTCTNGPNFRADAPVSSCTVGSTAANAGNSFTSTTCTLAPVSPAKAINGTCTVGTSQGPAPDYYNYDCTRPPANNTSGGTSLCTVGSSSSGDPTFITTDCSRPAATNYGPQPAPACAPGTTSTGAPDYITTVCAKTTDSTDYAASCTNDPGTSPPYVKVTCTTATLGNAAVTPASCTPDSGSAPSYIVTTCPRTPFGTYATQTPTSACSGGTGPGPDFVETACSNPPGPNNQTAFTTQAGCGPLGTTTGTAPDWITRTCRRPAGANNQTAFVDPANCFADPGTAFPFLKVTCTTAQLTGPTVVNPAAECTSFGTFVGPAPNYVVTRCVRQPVSGPTPVGACTPGVGPPPGYIVTACGTGTAFEPVASCTPGPAGNSGPPDYYDLFCSLTTNTTNVYSCTPQTASAPNWIQVTCNGPNTVDSRPWDPATCVPGNGPAPNNEVTTCTTAAAGAYPTATPVASCTPGTDSGTLITTTCTNPPANNYAAQDSAPCTEGTTTDASQVTTTCAKVTTVESVPTCSPLAQSGSGPEVTCSAPIVATDQPAPACSVGAVDGAPDFARTTACRTEEIPAGPTGAFYDYAGACTPDAGSAPGWVQTACGSRTLVTGVADSGCTPGTTTDGSTGVTTYCYNLAGGAGHLYRVSTTTTVTTTPYSGTAPVGPDVVTTSTSPETDVDGICYATPQSGFPPRPPVTIAGCTAWPCTETTTAGPGGSQNSLADVANYYYKTDLRPAMPDVVPPAGTGVEDDKATHQHMTTFTIGLGVSGTLKYQSDYRSPGTTTGDFADIRTGAKNWPVWPDPLVDYSNSNNYNNPKSIDDFWHTAVDGRGRYFAGNDPRSVVDGLGDAFASIDSLAASGAAEAVSSLEPVPGNNFAYATSYKSGIWSGDVQAYDIDLGTGGLSAARWSASERLGTRTFAACDNRDIVVMRGSAALGEFTWNTDVCSGGTPTGTLTTGLTAAERGFFGALNVSLLNQYPFMTDGTGGTVDQQAAANDPGRLVNFLRGQRGNEGYRSNSLTRLWRARESVLGDIVGSQPVFVRAPFAFYGDPGYGAFKTANASRRPMIYVGANDGMVHAFYATTDTTDPLHGQEAWAAIPSSVLPNMYKLASTDYRTGHQFYVDGTPVAADVYDGSAWRTILVGGLNAGGKGYYALDVTNAGARPLPLWEFKQDAAQCPAAPAGAVNNTGDCNIGLTYGKPVVTKLAGTWVVMVTSGYNNVNGAANGADGGGFLYVLNAITGRVIAKIPTNSGGTNVGTATTPSGLAQINNYVANTLIDNTTQRAYGTDVLGNVWRFDFSPNSATLVGTARDASNNPQPITTRPELAELNGKPFIMVGTGKLLGATDITDTSTQSVYGFTDTLTGNPVYADLRGALKPLRVNQVGTGATAVRTVACTTTGAPCARTAGWVVDLAEAGERVNVDIKLVLGTLAVASNVPQAVPCSIGGHSWFNLFDFRTGEAVSTAPNSIVGNTSSTRIVSSYLGDSLNVGFNVVRLPPPLGQNNGRFDASTRQGDGSRRQPPFWVADPLPLNKRISWREIAQ